MRIQFEFSADAANRLYSLKERTNAETLGKVIRNALRIYQWMHEVEGNGLKVASIKDAKIVHVLELLT